MSRLKIRWVLTRVALVIFILLLGQFVSQLGLITIRNPDCEQLRFVKENVVVQRNPNNVVKQVAPVEPKAAVTKEPETVKKSDATGADGKSVENLQKLADDLKSLAVELVDTRRSLVTSALHYHRVGQHIEALNGIIKSLGGETINQDENSSVGKSSENSAAKKEVCPEKFMGKNLAYGYPYFRKGFARVDCSEFVPINQLVTLLVNVPEEVSAKEQFGVFQGIAQYYPSIRIVLTSKENLPVKTVTKLKLNLKNIIATNFAHGETWTKMLKEVTTPYVLVAPDVTHFTDDIDLERLVRVLSNNQDAIIAGGSHRNLQGEWDIGCQQVTFRNWTAFFRGGYYRSFSECVVCDVLSGPFMAKTEGLRGLKIDEK